MTCFATAQRQCVPGSAVRDPTRVKSARIAAGPAWKYLPAVMAVALVFRVALALWSIRINHPDEIFQYLEPAHRLVYGYGFVTWEYRFGLRNWLLPGTLAGLLEFLRLLHIDRASAYIPVLKSIFAGLSVCLVFASYVIGRNLFSERTGRVAAVLAAVWYELLAVADVATPEVLGAYAIAGAFAIATLRANTRRVVWIGLLLGAGVALRPQYALTAFAVWASVLLVWGRRYALVLTIPCLVVPVFAGLLDYGTWGAPFSSYYYYFLFNSDTQLLQNFDPAGSVAPQSFLWYVTLLSISSLALYPAAALYGLADWRRCWPLLVLIACVLVPHSWIAHKEYRFIFLVHPLALLLVANLIVSGLPRLFGAARRDHAAVISVAAVCAVSLLGCTYRDVFARDGHLLAQLQLSRRSDVKAVFDFTGPWWKSGGFYYLHQDVPVYFPEQLGQLAKPDFRLYASHLIVNAGAAGIPGFRVASLNNGFAILEQISPPLVYRRLPGATREPPQPGVDDRGER